MSAYQKRFSEMSTKEKAIYALRGNLREARLWRLKGNQRKAEWHMRLAATYRNDALRTSAVTGEKEGDHV